MSARAWIAFAAVSTLWGIPSPGCAAGWRSVAARDPRRTHPCRCHRLTRWRGGYVADARAATVGVVRDVLTTRDVEPLASVLAADVR